MRERERERDLEGVGVDGLREGDFGARREEGARHARVQAREGDNVLRRFELPEQ